MKRERYTLKGKSGRYVKVRQGEKYFVNCQYGFDMSFEEQPSDSEGRVHTHVWVGNEDYPELVRELYLFLTWVHEYYPKGTFLFAIVHGWELSEDETKFEGPSPFYELVIHRKLSQTHINYLCEWLEDALAEFLPRMGMIGLFGKVGAPEGNEVVDTPLTSKGYNWTKDQLSDPPKSNGEKNEK